MSTDPTLKPRRGPEATIPALADGEMAQASDTHRLYVGTGSGNVRLLARPDPPIVASLPTLPNTAYPAGIMLVRSSDNTLWQNQSGTWVQVGGGGSLELTDGVTDLTGVTKVTVSGMTVGGTAGAATLSASGGSGAMARIGQIIVGSGGAANAIFSSISGAYSSLLLVGSMRSTTSAVNSPLLLQLNTDTAANYAYQNLHASGTSVVGLATAAATSVGAGQMPAATAPANNFAALVLEIPNYANTTTYKALLSRTHTTFGTGTSVQLDQVSGYWASTAAITALKLFPTAGLFAEFTELTLWGLT